jgi:hypothetical protein
MYSIDRDTTIAGIDCQIYSYYQRTQFTGVPGSQIVEITDSSLILGLEDSVLYHYIESTQTFDTVFNFNAAVGESWNLYDRAIECLNGEANYYNAVVLDTGTATINSRDLRYSLVEYNHSELPQPIVDTFYAQVGSLSSSFWFRRILTCNQIDAATESFRCYFSDFGLSTEFEYSVYNNPCDWPLTANLSNQESPIPQLYPNPVNDDYIYIETDQKLEKEGIVIKDSLGRKISDYELISYPNSYKILLPNISSGSYYLEINQPYPNNLSLKIIIL